MTWITIEDEFRLFEAVQGCANEPELWETALEQITSVFGGHAHLLEVDTQGQLTGRTFHTPTSSALAAYLGGTKIESGVSPLSFLVHEAPLNYLFCKSKIMSLVAAGGLSRTDDSIFDRQVGLMTPVWRPVDETVIFALLFNELAAGEAHRSLVRASFTRLSKVISNTFAAALALEKADAKIRLLKLQSEAPHISSALVDQDLRLVQASPAFKDALSRSDTFMLKGDLLVPVDLRAEQLLHKMTAALTANPKPGKKQQDLVGTSNTVFIPIQDGQSFTRVTCRVVPSPLKHRTFAETPLLQIELQHQKDLSPQIMGVLHDTYGLSQREAELAYILASTGSAVEATEMLGITRNTVKTHLRRIFDKTGTQSQLEVSNLIHRLSQLFV